MTRSSKRPHQLLDDCDHRNSIDAFKGCDSRVSHGAGGATARLPGAGAAGRAAAAVAAGPGERPWLVGAPTRAFTARHLTVTFDYRGTGARKHRRASDHGVLCRRRGGGARRPRARHRGGLRNLDGRTDRADARDPPPGAAQPPSPGLHHARRATRHRTRTGRAARPRHNRTTMLQATSPPRLVALRGRATSPTRSCASAIPAGASVRVRLRRS